MRRSRRGKRSSNSRKKRSDKRERVLSGLHRRQASQHTVLTESLFYIHRTLLLMKHKTYFETNIVWYTTSQPDFTSQRRQALNKVALLPGASRRKNWRKRFSVLLPLHSRYSASTLTLHSFTLYTLPLHSPYPSCTIPLHLTSIHPLSSLPPSTFLLYCLFCARNISSAKLSKQY